MRKFLIRWWYTGNWPVERNEQIVRLWNEKQDKPVAELPPGAYQTYYQDAPVIGPNAFELMYDERLLMLYDLAAEITAEIQARVR